MRELVFILINANNYKGAVDPYQTALTVGAFNDASSQFITVVLAVGCALIFTTVLSRR